MPLFGRLGFVWGTCQRPVLMLLVDFQSAFSQCIVFATLLNLFYPGGIVLWLGYVLILWRYRTYCRPDIPTDNFICGLRDLTPQDLTPDVTLSGRPFCAECLPAAHAGPAVQAWHGRHNMMFIIFSCFVGFGRYAHTADQTRSVRTVCVLVLDYRIPARCRDRATRAKTSIHCA